MKTQVIIFLFLLSSYYASAQSTSNITYDAGTSIQIDIGADVCADQIIINGTFSGAGTICGGVLPVSLSSFTFTVNKRDVLLEWTTEWEMNNSSFRVERTYAGLNNWVETGFINGGGTTNEQKRYMFTDKNLGTGKYEYRLKQVDFNGGNEYFELNKEVAIAPPKSFQLSQNYPNPSNPKSKINFEIPVDGRVTVKIYDIIGKEVMTIIDKELAADYYTVEFDGSNLASGLYFYRITAAGYSAVKKMILVK